MPTVDPRKEKEIPRIAEEGTIMIEITDNPIVVMIDMIAGTEQITTTKIQETPIKGKETNEKEAETKKEAGVMTNKVISIKSIPPETEIIRGDNIEMNSLKNSGNLKLILIVKMMITLNTQMKRKDKLNNLIQK